MAMVVNKNTYILIIRYLMEFIVFFFIYYKVDRYGTVGYIIATILIVGYIIVSRKNQLLPQTQRNNPNAEEKL